MMNDTKTSLGNRNHRDPVPVERIEVPGDQLELTGLQRAGLKLALGVGGVGAVALVFLGFLWVTTIPAPPMIPVDATSSARAAALADYTAINQLAVDRVTTLFGLVITTTLLPVFTGILGYIFGTRNEGSSDTS